MCYRVVVKTAHKKICGQWTSKNQAVNEVLFWRQIVKNIASVEMESEDTIDE